MESIVRGSHPVAARRTLLRSAGLRGTIGRIKNARADVDIAALQPATAFEPLAECHVARPAFASGCGQEHVHAPHPLALLALLRARRQRPPCRRAADQRDELAAFHSINSSARSKNASGIFSPNALAVVRLITRSNLVGCSTGMSPGFAPRRILSTRSPARRYMLGKFGP